jgi:hypothetical protein
MRWARRCGGSFGPVLRALQVGSALALVHTACSSDGGVADGGADAPIADTGPGKDGGAADSGVDATIGDSGGDSTLSDAGIDSTLSDAGLDATLTDASNDASTCVEAAPPDASLTTLWSDGLSGAAFVAVDGTNVYFTSTAGFGSVMKCAIGGCGGSPTTIASGFVGVGLMGIAVDGTNVYWTVFGAADAGAGAIMSCPIGGCDGGVPNTLAAGQEQPWFIAVDATNVYWTDPPAGTVMSCPKTGCNGSPTTLASGQDHPWGIAVDSADIYWTAVGNSGGLMKCSLSSCGDGGSPIALYPGAGVAQIALDSDNVYATAGGSGGAVVKFTKDGGAPVLLAQQDYPFAIATDGANVYWTDQETQTAGHVHKCGVDGCCMTPITMTPAQPNPWGIAVDGTNVYWANLGSYPDAGAVEELTPK